MWNERAQVLAVFSDVQATPNSPRVKQVEEQVTALRSSVICAFNQLLDLKGLNTGVHNTRLAEWGMRVGQELGLEEVKLQNLEVAALLHNMGKMGIPDAILRKPSRLAPEEYALMKNSLSTDGQSCACCRDSNALLSTFFTTTITSMEKAIQLG